MCAPTSLMLMLLSINDKARNIDKCVRLVGARINHRTFGRTAWLRFRRNGDGHSKHTHTYIYSKYSRNLRRTHAPTDTHWKQIKMLCTHRGHRVRRRTAVCGVAIAPKAVGMAPIMKTLGGAYCSNVVGYHQCRRSGSDGSVYGYLELDYAICRPAKSRFACARTVRRFDGIVLLNELHACNTNTHTHACHNCAYTTECIHHVGGHTCNT